MTLVHSDARGRLSLGKIVEANRDYRVQTGPHGIVTLEPVTVITDYERSILARPELVDAFDRAAEALARGEVVRGKRRQDV